MKPYLYLIIAFLITCHAVQAQYANIGIKGGLNAYTIEGDNSGGNDLKLSFNLGLLAHFHMGDQFAIQPELVYSGQGMQHKIAGANMDLNLNNINIPLLFQYMFDNGFRLEAGP
ncbi:MAG: hypothetical protein ACJAVY_002207 [Marinoscillum sp.]|jgi:hypothetical protein